ncbi:helix-turn-helix domain-containing protein [Bifidobacterium tsurumiense]|uniref:helix-turn-helix domain-containing protein n=2 Tax=Bifidobacterium tsurumiense TaxID=356829 RepID=UPI001269B3B2
MTQSDLDAEYMERVVSWNVKMLLTAYGKSQTALAEALGIQRAAMSKKIKGVNSWSLSDLVKTARFLDTKTETLMDDSLMRRMGVADTKKAASEEAASDGLLRLGLNQRPSD